MTKPLEQRRLCGARKKTGGTCGASPLRRKDGTQTKRCRVHGGPNERAAPGDPMRPGRPPVLGLYSKFVLPEERDAYTRAPVGTLDEEIRLAKAKLAWAQQQHRRDPNGGTEVEYGGRTKIRLWADVVREHLDNVRKLELGRAQIDSLNPAGDPSDALPEHEAWLEATRSPTQPHGAEPRDRSDNSKKPRTQSKKAKHRAKKK